MGNIASKGEKDNRARSWTIVVYPGDSLPDNWQDILDELSVPWCASPLHDRDLNADGTPKKAHRHIVLSFEGKKSYEQVEAIAERLGAPIPKRIHSVRAMVRYCLHLDNPDKAQYSRADLLSGCGFDVEDALKLSASETESIVSDIEDYILEKHANEYVSVLRNLKKYHPEWVEVFRRHTMHFQAILTSSRCAEVVVDFETGEEF